MRKPLGSPPQVLASTGIARIELCGCRGVRLTIGAVSVRLPPGAFAQLHEAVCRAMAGLSTLSDPVSGTRH